MIEIKVASPADLESLLNVGDYEALLA